jgi:hypothetical protein
MWGQLVGCKCGTSEYLGIGRNYTLFGSSTMCYMHVRSTETAVAKLCMCAQMYVHVHVWCIFCTCT